ncbi:hypothetical protein HDU99_009289, partial [Rhizoclosmatium hyalinum]
MGNGASTPRRPSVQSGQNMGYTTSTGPYLRDAGRSVTEPANYPRESQRESQAQTHQAGYQAGYQQPGQQQLNRASSMRSQSQSQSQYSPTNYSSKAMAISSPDIHQTMSTYGTSYDASNDAL